jgi:putative CocE/NonD family hydrolase
MRDGTVLRADVYRPQDGEPHPVLLFRTPYNKDGRSTLDELRATAAGYIVVNQDCRGTWASDGEFDVFLDEVADGEDTVAWARSQEWCDGRVGAFGLSYTGYTAWAAGCSGAEGLSAVVAMQSPND